MLSQSTVRWGASKALLIWYEGGADREVAHESESSDKSSEPNFAEDYGTVSGDPRGRRRESSNDLPYERSPRRRQAERPLTRTRSLGPVDPQPPPRSSLRPAESGQTGRHEAVKYGEEAARARLPFPPSSPSAKITLILIVLDAIVAIAITIAVERLRSDSGS